MATNSIDYGRPELSFVRAIDLNMTLGECVTWDENLNRLWWTDIEQQRLYLLEGLESEPIAFEMPHRVASFALTSEPEKLLLAFDNGLGVFDVQTESTHRLCYIEKNEPLTRLNDGRADRYGNFWVGSMYSEPTDNCPKIGKLYVYKGGRDLSVFRTDIRLSNGLAFSADRKYMYFADTKAYNIEQYQISAETGSPHSGAKFADIPQDEHADGACTDASGCLWSANWGEGNIRRYAPDGELLSEQKIISSEPTCLTFGGPKLDHLCVVTGRLGESPSGKNGDGSLLIYHSNIRGVPEGRFSGQLAWDP